MPTDQLSRTFAALADPTRRAMLSRLTRGEATVGQLAEPFDLTFAAVSKHLRVLEHAGLVSRGRDAQYRPAQLDARPLAAASGWIGDYAQFWHDSFDTLGDYLGRLQGSPAPGEAPAAHAVPAALVPAAPAAPAVRAAPTSAPALLAPAAPAPPPAAPTTSATPTAPTTPATRATRATPATPSTTPTSRTHPRGDHS
ncbi:ArsR/SmtB family transcription factor [Subtercola endophyticus]|uniref:ArsR/SmtB family transcription factor n=1 Tax=Subtercola endophyticus TaxID=2895559 RepID=UPI0036F2835A